MYQPEDDVEIINNACTEAYKEAIRMAFKTLSASIADYVDEDPKRYVSELSEVSASFRPLKEYQRTLKIQQLTLRLARRAAGLPPTDVAKVQLLTGIVETHEQFLVKVSNSESNPRNSFRLT